MWQKEVHSPRKCSPRFALPRFFSSLSSIPQQALLNSFVQAFGTQSKLSSVYLSHVTQAFAADVRISMITGIGLGSIFFIIYASYGLAFSFGTTLMLRG